jgi:uncharacterized membrane protein
MGALQPGSLLLVSLLLLVVFFLVLRALWGVGGQPRRPSKPPDAVGIARRRGAARGAISKAEYERLRTDLTQAHR